MPSIRMLAASILLLCIASTADALPGHPLPLARALRFGGGPTIPAAWSGIWASTDTSRDCATQALISADAYTDTLCTGAPAYSDTSGGFNFTCTGTVTDVSVNLVCTGSFDFGGCLVEYRDELQGTRNGGTFTSHSRFTTTFTPTMCLFQADSCEDTYTTATRIAPQPASCTTPTRRSSWGSLKTLYR